MKTSRELKQKYEKPREEHVLHQGGGAHLNMHLCLCNCNFRALMTNNNSSLASFFAVYVRLRKAWWQRVNWRVFFFFFGYNFNLCKVITSCTCLRELWRPSFASAHQVTLLLGIYFYLFDLNTAFLSWNLPFLLQLRFFLFLDKHITYYLITSITFLELVCRTFLWQYQKSAHPFTTDRETWADNSTNLP